MTTGQSEVLPLGGIRQILKCLRRDDHQVVRYALAAVLNLSTDEANEAEIFRLGGYRDILHCLSLQDIGM